MSVQAVAWALEDAPDVPPNLVSTLIALANHADRYGCGSYPSTETVSHYTRKSTRQAQRDLDELQARGLIRLGDQRLVLHVRPDRRPTVWDLAINIQRGDARVTPQHANGVTSKVERGDIQGHHGVTPMSPEPKEEPTTEPNPSSAIASAPAALDLDLPDLPPAAVKARGRSKAKTAKTEEADPNAGVVTKAWIDAMNANGVKPIPRQIGQAGREAKELLAAGNNIDHVLTAARSAGSRGFPGIAREFAALAARSNGSARNGDYRPSSVRRPDNDYAGDIT